MAKIHSAFSKVILILAICLTPLVTQSVASAQGITLYTQYINRSVTPGQALNYDIEIINTTDDIQNVGLAAVGIPDSWDPTFTAGANTIRQIAVKPQLDESGSSVKNINLDLNVPLKIEKGIYRFSVLAETDSGLEYELPLTVRVTEQGIFTTELQVDQANMEGYADSDFTYNFTLNNQTAREQNYALAADAPPGWDVRFRSGSDYVTSVTVPSNENQNMRVNVTPSQNARADTTRITIQARSGNTSDQATLEAVVKGRYDLNLTTPSGRLSSEITAGSENSITLALQNTGTVPLHDISLEASPPTGWNIEFENQQITQINPGETATVDATVTAANQAIAGDYQFDITAETPQTASQATFRITVKKSLAWGSIGIVIILVVAGGISYLFKAYGRR